MASPAERRPALLGAVELGGSKVLCAVAEGDIIVAETRVPTSTPELTQAAVTAFFAPYRGALLALGVASFGPLELRAGERFGALLTTPKPGWSGTPLRAALERELGVRVAIDTDVNAAALAEQRLGAGRGADPCVYVTVGTGIGVGIQLRGGPLHGLLHPELGHLPAPPLCDSPGVCVFHGRCIEGVASAPALRARAGEALEVLADDHPLWQLEARYLAHLLVAVVLAYAPARIVLGGGVLQRRGLLERIREQLGPLLAGYIPRAELTPSGLERYLVPAQLEPRAGLIGALLLAQGIAS